MSTHLPKNIHRRLEIPPLPKATVVEIKFDRRIPGLPTPARDCPHHRTHFDPLGWPTGEDLEVCKDCGASRTHWEQGTSTWVHFEKSISEERADLQAHFDNLTTKPSN